MPYGETDRAFVARLAELVADHDDALLAEYLDDEAGLGYGRLMTALAAQARRGLVHPVFFGSAITGAGLEQLTAGLTELLPAADTKAEADGPVSAAVCKVERGPPGEKIAYARMFSGTLRVRDRVRIGRDRQGRVTAIRVFDRGGASQAGDVAAGQIGELSGLADVQIGDALGEPPPGRVAHHFAPPSLETVVGPAGTGAAAEFMGRASPFRATVGLRIGPAPVGSGVSFGLEIEPGALPSAFTRAVAETARQSLTQGIFGWPVTSTVRCRPPPCTRCSSCCRG